MSTTSEVIVMLQGRPHDGVDFQLQEETVNQRMLAFDYLVIFALFAAFSGFALAKAGVIGFFEPLFTQWGPAQVFVDLVIMGLVTIGWMVRDARQRQRTVWPYVVLTAVLGSVGPLLYLAVRARQTADRPAPAIRPQAGAASR